MSRWDDPYDNAVAENFFSCLKCELIHLKHCPTRAAGKGTMLKQDAVLDNKTTSSYTEHREGVAVSG